MCSACGGTNDVVWLHGGSEKWGQSFHKPGIVTDGSELAFSKLLLFHFYHSMNEDSYIDHTGTLNYKLLHSATKCPSFIQDMPDIPVTKLQRLNHRTMYSSITKFAVCMMSN